MNPFKPGDKVKCVEGDEMRIFTGSVYTVALVNERFVSVCEDKNRPADDRLGWLPSRFKLVGPTDFSQTDEGGVV